MKVTPSGILELCALVASSHGRIGEAIADAIRAIDLNNVLESTAVESLEEAEDGRRRKYIYRKTVKGFEYVYFRMPSGRLIRLAKNETSAEFRRHYAYYLSRVKFEKPIGKQS